MLLNVGPITCKDHDMGEQCVKSIYSPACILVHKWDGIGVDSSGIAVEIVGALGTEPTCASGSTR